ncbi:hypothetical protein EGW08_005316 [Elysia chlorotica]|uniref:Uncharacterized protein n=1 Tax=Elysia chlorotica TaxID=188477 RepID=A0A3S1HVJ5_ELYCH|nr:hypothetical protein EGW08_005316 [Elysia chlorotica]
MEGYVFALLANSGTDPDLEEEDAQREREQQDKERKLREKELQLRYLVELNVCKKKAKATRSLERMLERADADLDSKSPVQDHYAACWPWETGSQTPCKKSHRTISREAPVAELALESIGISANQKEVLPEIPMRNTRPAPFEAGSTAESYSTIPPLRMSILGFPRNNFPRTSAKTSSRRASLMLQQKKIMVQSMCCKPPHHPMEGLYFQSYEVLKRHYDSLSNLCT